jgi:hypothetical protein
MWKILLVRGNVCCAGVKPVLLGPLPVGTGTLCHLLECHVRQAQAAQFPVSWPPAGYELGLQVALRQQAILVHPSDGFIS